MAITARLACGCAIAVPEDGTAPTCETHGEHRVQSVNTGPPRIRAYCHATGPYVVQVKE